MGRLCEEFPGRLPTEMVTEWRRLPAGFLEQLLEYRHYAEAKRMLDAADTREAQERLPAHPLIELARVIEFEIAQEAMHRG